MIRLKRGLWALTVLALLGIVSCGEGDPVTPELAVMSGEAPVQMDAGESSPVRPLKASTRGMLVGMEPAPEGRCPPERPMLASYLGRGNATHMGRIAVSGSECLFGDPTDPSTLQSGEGVFTLTAANRDELVVGYDQTVLQPEGPASPWILWSADIYAIDGTGRFEGAELVDAAWIGGLNLMTFETWSDMEGGIRLR